MTLVKRLEGVGKASGYVAATSVLVLAEPILKGIFDLTAETVKTIDPDTYTLIEMERLPKGLRETLQRSYRTANKGFWLNLDRATFGVEPE